MNESGMERATNATQHHASAEADPRWGHVLRRTDAEQAFVYAVRTTGIYCRPSCPSRRARPENVSFFASPAEAEAAGYRPCKRCHPDGPSPDEQLARIVVEACRRIESAPNPPRLAELAAAAGMSSFHFHRKFREITGLTPREWAAAHRARKARAMLTTEGKSITSALYEAGFGSSSGFYGQAERMFGMTPSMFRNGGEGSANGGNGAAICFAIGHGSLGAVLVAASSKGICWIALGDDEQALVAELQAQFPGATAADDGDDGAANGEATGFAALVRRVVAFVDAPGTGLDLPLDLRGTAFQQRVWKELSRIPPGETLSYANVARRIGQPRAVRAVAQACGANKLAVAIPCHRVVRSDGALSGYRWGAERKQALLAKEG